uniref:Uncharacterized protein n=1 Tax=Proboscia inermis TaxID=420281 RepID=A0A7S0GAV2_9STRA
MELKNSPQQSQLNPHRNRLYLPPLQNSHHFAETIRSIVNFSLRIEHNLKIAVKLRGTRSLFFYHLRDSCAASKRRVLRQDTNADTHDTSNDTVFLTSVHNMRIVPGPHDAKMLADTRKNLNALSKFSSNGINPEENGDDGFTSTQVQIMAQMSDNQNEVIKIIHNEQSELVKMIRREQAEQKTLCKEFSVIIFVCTTLAVMTLVQLKRS